MYIRNDKIIKYRLTIMSYFKILQTAFISFYCKILGPRTTISLLHPNTAISLLHIHPAISLLHPNTAISLLHIHTAISLLYIMFYV